MSRKSSDVKHCSGWQSFWLLQGEHGGLDGDFVTIIGCWRQQDQRIQLATLQWEVAPDMDMRERYKRGKDSDVALPIAAVEACLSKSLLPSLASVMRFKQTIKSTHPRQFHEHHNSSSSSSSIDYLAIDLKLLTETDPFRSCSAWRCRKKVLAWFSLRTCALRFNRWILRPARDRSVAFFKTFIALTGILGMRGTCCRLPQRDRFGMISASFCLWL